MGRIGRRPSLRLLDRAYDEGIRYFDTAPSYGQGEVEAVVGQFASARRDSVVIATKVGLMPQRGNLLLKVAKHVARPMVAASASLRRQLRHRFESVLQPRACFDHVAARTSLEQSLRRLRTDYIDILLLHDCGMPDLADERLLSMLFAEQSAGKINAFGIGTDIETIEAAMQLTPSFTHVLQFANNAANVNIGRIRASPETLCVTHSPFGGFGRVPIDELRITSAREREQAAGALLRYAARSNPPGIVLFSTQREERIVANILSLAASSEFDDVLLDSMLPGEAAVNSG